MNRCIACYRCVRFYCDYAGGTDFGVFSLRNQVYFGRARTTARCESEFSGNLVEVCPIGVFDDKTLAAHYTRKWDLQTAPSVCPHCGAAAPSFVGERYGELRRVLNRYNRQVNGYFLCDRGRFGYQFVNATTACARRCVRDGRRAERLRAPTAATAADEPRTPSSPAATTPGATAGRVSGAGRRGRRRRTTPERRGGRHGRTAATAGRRRRRSASARRAPRSRRTTRCARWSGRSASTWASRSAERDARRSRRRAAARRPVAERDLTAHATRPTSCWCSATTSPTTAPILDLNVRTWLRLRPTAEEERLHIPRWNDAGAGPAQGDGAQRPVDRPHARHEARRRGRAAPCTRRRTRWPAVAAALAHGVDPALPPVADLPTQLAGLVDETIGRAQGRGAAGGHHRHGRRQRGAAARGGAARLGAARGEDGAARRSPSCSRRRTRWASLLLGGGRLSEAFAARGGGRARPPRWCSRTTSSGARPARPRRARSRALPTRRRARLT